MKCPKCDEEDDDCYCSRCNECGSRNLRYYDDGEGYPPNIKCLDCEHWD